MRASQRTWIIRLLWLCVGIMAGLAVRAPKLSMAAVSIVSAAGYAVFATEFARRTR